MLNVRGWAAGCGDDGDEEEVEEEEEEEAAAAVARKMPARRPFCEGVGWGRKKPRRPVCVNIVMVVYGV